jgi:hypothetical protein
MPNEASTSRVKQKLPMTNSAVTLCTTLGTEVHGTKCVVGDPRIITRKLTLAMDMEILHSVNQS